MSKIGESSLFFLSPDFHFTCKTIFTIYPKFINMFPSIQLLSSRLDYDKCHQTSVSAPFSFPPTPSIVISSQCSNFCLFKDTLVFPSCSEWIVNSWSWASKGSRDLALSCLLNLLVFPSLILPSPWPSCCFSETPRLFPFQALSCVFCLLCFASDWTLLTSPVPSHLKC